MSGDLLSAPHLEGERYLGTLTADANGNFSGTLTVNGISIGDSIVATATDAIGNTSEFGSFYFTQGVILPMHVKNFNAIKKDKTVLLNWTTQQENNRNSFMVERSNNNYSFNAIGEVSVKVNSFSASGYQYSDNQPLEKINYYRLKQLDASGRITYSEIKMVNFSMEKISFAVYPNPASELIVVEAYSLQKNISVKLFNLNGQIVSVKQFSSVSKVYIPVSTLPNGNYFIEVIADSKKFVNQISINK